MVAFTDKQTYRDLVAICIEKVLLQVSTPALELAEAKLKEEHDCSFSDCLENPEYLKQVLFEIYGNSYDQIVQKINVELQKFRANRDLENFLRVLSS